MNWLEELKDERKRLIQYEGDYPVLVGYFGGGYLGNDWVVGYSSVDRTMNTFVNDISRKEEILVLHTELTTILSKDPKEQFEILESFHQSGMYFDHKHLATLLFTSLLHFTEKEMNKRKIEIPRENKIKRKL